MMDKNEIEQRVAALKATAASNGAESTDGSWILLRENARARKNFVDAICLRQLLGISEDTMVQQLGGRWRKQFTRETCGFIHRKWKGCTFISVQTRDENESNVPSESNIINRGDNKTNAIQNFIENIVSSSKEDREDEDAVGTEENDVTIDCMDEKMLQNVFNLFPLDDIRCTLACVNKKWNKTALATTSSPNDYLTTLKEERIPCIIEYLGQQKEQVSGLNCIFTLVRQNTNLQNAIGDVIVQQRVTDAKRKVVDAPTVENCSRLLNCALDDCEATGKCVPIELQHIARRILLIIQQQQQQQQNEQLDADDSEEEQPRQRQQQGVISLKYYAGNAKRTQTMQVQVKATTRSCKTAASTKIKQQRIRRVAKVAQDTITERMGVNDSDEFRLKVLQQLAKINGLSFFNSSEMVFSFEECFTLLHKANLSINQLCIVASFIRIMRPDLKGLLWPNQLKKGICDFIGEDNLGFIVKQLPLIVSKSEDKWSNRPFWYLTRPGELAQRLVERSILDGSFEESIEFSFLSNCIVVVWGIDKADRDTAASLRVANRCRGNSSKHTQLIAATEDAAECYTNIMQTFVNPIYPVKGYLQQLTYDNYHMLVLTIGEENIKVCRCITILPTPSPEPCTIRQISSTFIDDPIASDDVDWDEPYDNLPHIVPYCDQYVLSLCLIQTDEEITGIQISNPNSEHSVNIAFKIPIYFESLSNTDLRTIKTVIHQIVGIPSNDYKLNHSLTGICSASATNSCVCCMAQTSHFKHLSEALHRHRNPASDPPHKDAPLRQGINSTKACHDRIMTSTGGGCLPLPDKRRREITSANGSCFHAPGLDILPIKLAHGEVLHIGGGIINHFFRAIFSFLREIDLHSAWFQNAKSIYSTVTTQLEEELTLDKSSSTQFRKDYKECQKLLREQKQCQARAEKLREQLEKRSSEEESVDQVALEEVEIAEAKATEAMNAILKHAKDDTDLAHKMKLRKGNTELKKMLENYFKDSNKKPRGEGEYSFKAALAACGANFLTQHGGSDLTTDNGMDVMEKFDEVATYTVQAYPEDSEEGKKIRDFFGLCKPLAKELAGLLKFMKSQQKCNATDFLDKLDKFLTRWDAALPNKEYFLKLHHLIHHVVEFIKRYGMLGRVSAEGFEAFHPLISKLKSMSRSQSTLNRIKTTNSKLQTVMKPEVMTATEMYTKRSTGKKRGPYDTTPSTQSTEAAESFEAYGIETHEGVEFIKVFAGEGIVLKDHEDVWRMLSTSYTPPKWGEHFQSSQTIPQEKKRKISSGADLNLN